MHTIFTKAQTFHLKILIPNGNSWHNFISHSSIATQSLVSILGKSKACGSPSMAKMAHASILRSGYESNLHLSNNLLRDYWFCGLICHALHLFDNMLQRDVVSWNTMISGFIRLELFRNGFCVFGDMVRIGTRPTQSTFASIVAACVGMCCIECMHQIHCFSMKMGFSSDCCVGNSLLNGYSKLGELEDLRKVSDEMCGLDEISIETLSRGYSQCGSLFDALDLIRYCSISGIKLTPFAVSSLISLCSRLCSVHSGTQIHGYSSKVGFDSHISVVNSLISLYSKAYRLEDAMHLFDWIAIQDRDIITWNSLVGGFAYNGQGDAGLGLVQRMLSSGFMMNESTFLNLLSCCANISALRNAKKAHNLTLKMRDCFHRGTDNIMLAMYCKCKSFEDATSVFEAMEGHDITSYNHMISLHKNCGNYEDSIVIFLCARSRSIGVDEVMLAGVICSCSQLEFLELGQQIHGSVVRNGFGKAFNVKNAILELYSQVGRVDDMENFFSENCNGADDIFTWNMMLIGYTRRGFLGKSIDVWKEMERLGVVINEFSYSALLDACGCPRWRAIGEQIHACAQRKGLVFDTALMNSLLTMYSNCGSMEKAHLVFEEICSPDCISWNAMVSGYSQNGFAEESIKFYTMMNTNDVETNYMTFASIFMSCAMLSDLKLGTQFHAHVIKRGFELDLPVSNALITMFAKCGEISRSLEIFERMVRKDVISWNSMINALSHHGFGRKAIAMFKKMKSFSVIPDSVTFIGVISACSHAGLVSEACHQFQSMNEDYGISPNEEHYSCMVDILCRAGKLTEAKDLIEGMPFLPSSCVWKTFLSACRVNGDAELGKMAAKKLMEMEPGDSSAYVLLSELYATLGNRKGKAEVRRLMDYRGLKKEVGCSWILS